MCDREPINQKKKSNLNKFEVNAAAKTFIVYEYTFKNFHHMNTHILA